MHGSTVAAESQFAGATTTTKIRWHCAGLRWKRPLVRRLGSIDGSTDTVPSRTAIVAVTTVVVGFWHLLIAVYVAAAVTGRLRHNDGSVGHRVTGFDDELCCPTDV